MRLSTNQFLATCEKTNNDLLAEHITYNFISSMKICNPEMTYMTNSDWLSVMLNDYDVVINDGDIQLVAKSTKKDEEILKIFTEFND